MTLLALKQYLPKSLEMWLKRSCGNTGFTQWKTLSYEQERVEEIVRKDTKPKCHSDPSLDGFSPDVFSIFVFRILIFRKREFSSLKRHIISCKMEGKVNINPPTHTHTHAQLTSVPNRQTPRHHRSYTHAHY